MLTKKFLNLIERAPGGILDLNEAADTLQVRAAAVPVAALQSERYRIAFFAAMAIAAACASARYAQRVVCFVKCHAPYQMPIGPEAAHL